MIEEKPFFFLFFQVILEGRTRLSISGVLKVESCDENTVVLVTNMGDFIIHGEQLQMNKTDVQTGEFSLEGTVQEMIYADEKSSGKGNGFFSRMFK